MILPRLEGHRDRAVDDVKRPMPLHLARVPAQLLGQSVSVGMHLRHSARVFLDFKEPNRHPNRIHIRLRRDEIAQPRHGVGI